jgi:hypothetical protein
MEIEPNLKPLYANLKMLKIGDYLYTEEFKLFTIETDYDDIWIKCKKVVSNKKTVFIVGHHDTGEEEEAFLYLMTWCLYDQV